MSTLSTIETPGGFAPAAAMAFGSLGGPAVMVDADHPLPTAPVMAAAASTPLNGQASAPVAAGPFAPQLARPVWLTLTGTWTGSVQLLRSTDGGATRLPLTVAGQPWATYVANCNEAVFEETIAGATCYLAITPVSGSVTYTVSQ